VTSLLPYITGSGGALAVLAIVAYLFFAGKIHSESEFQRVTEAWQQEKESHDRTRHALELANTRADVGMRPAELIAAALELTKEHGRGEEPVQERS
jgi:hypothetical protein